MFQIRIAIIASTIILSTMTASTNQIYLNSNIDKINVANLRKQSSNLNEVEFVNPLEAEFESRQVEIADQIKVANQITSVLEKETNIEDIYINKEIKEEVVEIDNIQRAVELLENDADKSNRIEFSDIEYALKAIDIYEKKYNKMPTEFNLIKEENKYYMFR